MVNVFLQVDFFFPFNGIFWIFNISEMLELFKKLQSSFHCVFSFFSPFFQHREGGIEVEGDMLFKRPLWCVSVCV